MRCSHSEAQRGAAHTHSDMARRAERCVMISVCLAVCWLLLLPLCWGVEFDQYNIDYDSTQTPEPDYNSTFDYTFFSNASHDELERFLKEGELDFEGETSFTETDGSVHQEKPTKPTVIVGNQASRSSPVCFLATFVVIVHQLLRLL